MINNEASPLQVIVYEGTGAVALPTSARTQIFTALLDKGYAVSRATPQAAQRSLSPQPNGHRLVVLGDFGGNAPALEDVAGDTEIDAHDIGGLAATEVLDLVESARDGTPMNQPGAWKPWFPVIDYDRCTNCMQCLSFCLFDVYAASDEGKIQVQNNDNCKTNCPACSRVCPEVAIMFPRYSGGPINGDVVSESDLSREKMKVDISSLLGGDIYSRLRDRSEAAKSRFSKERDSGKALNERKRCLTKLVSSGDIPAEVLASLPSQEEILRKAEEAAAKAKAALEMNAKGA